MKPNSRKFGAAERGLLPEGRLAGPMPWVIAIMMFLTVLAAAAGLGLGSAAARLDDQIGNRVTIQIVEANGELRDRQAAAVTSTLSRLPGIRTLRLVPQEEISAMLEPWLGAGGAEADLPVPALIDVDLDPQGGLTVAALRDAAVATAPSARVDENAQFLAPLASLIGALKWLAAGLVLLMVGATTATVVLAARAALDTHRQTIEILHLMGATDIQVARLFQRRIALDALFGGAIGFILAAIILFLLGQRISALGSELLGSTSISLERGAIMLILPLFGVLLAMMVARLTILRALGRML